MRIWMLLLVGCGGPVAPDPTDPDATVPPDETDVPTPDPEIDCDDELDNDNDGAVDCQDSDCAAEVFCSWPQAGIDFGVTFFFDASPLAQTFGYNDCTYEADSFLVRDRAQSCVGCDRVYCGQFTVIQDTCPQDAALQRPTEGCYGFAFTSDTQWDVYFENPDTQGFEILGTAVQGMTPGMLEYSNSEPVIFEGVNAGSVSGAFSFVGDP